MGLPLNDVSNVPPTRLIRPKFFTQKSNCENGSNRESIPSTIPSNLSRRDVSPCNTAGLTRPPIPNRKYTPREACRSSGKPAPRAASASFCPRPRATVSTVNTRAMSPAMRNGNSTPSRARTASAPSASDVQQLHKRNQEAREERERVQERKKALMEKFATLREIESAAMQMRAQHEMEFKSTQEELLLAKPQWEKQVEDERRRRDQNALRKIECQQALVVELETSATLEKSACQRRVLITREEARSSELKLEAERENAEEVLMLEKLTQQNKVVDEYTALCAQQEKRRGELVISHMRYFNEHMEAKGNIRVFVRMRPPAHNEQSCITVEENTVSLRSTSYKTVDGLHDQTSSWSFAFDRVFSEDCSQHTVFDEISLLIQSALDGFKVAIFAYGQTGSGKTYTMEGLPSRQSNGVRRSLRDAAGVIPRALRLIFNHIDKLADTGWTYGLSASYVEIYNEVVRDLLGKDIVELKQDHNETTMNCKVVDVVNEKHILALLAKASEARATASTLTNDRSSRSHIVFQLRINATGPKNTELRGLLSLVDLAGSERIEKSQAVGERLKEAQCINKSLSALGDVIQSLADNASHVPYRNSKLTMLLRDSLGGNSKTLMFANICPSQSNLQESVNTLRFATKVNSVCSVEKAKKGRRKLDT